MYFSFSIWEFPGSSVGKESACGAGDPGWIPGSRRCPGEENGNSFQHSCPEILWEEESGGLQPMDMTKRLTHELDIYCSCV